MTSEVIPPDEIRAISKAFGAGRPALIVDWHGRQKSFGPIEARPAELAKVAIGIAPGAGTATQRATRLDWGWNPEAYDRDRSLKLACREFAGFANWKKLYELVAALEYAAPGPAYQPRRQALAEYAAGLERCATLIEEMKKLPASGLAGRVKLPATAPAPMPQNVVTHIEPTLKALQESKPRILEFGFRELVAVRASKPPKIDGLLDDDAWRDAPVATGFADRGKPYPADRQTAFRCVWNTRRLYVAFEVHTPKPIDLQARPHTLGVPLPGPATKQTGRDLRGIGSLHAWEAMALMLDPKHTHLADYEFQFDAAGHRADGLFDTSSGVSPNGLAFNSDWTCVVKVAEDGWTAELAVPWQDLGVRPKAGMVMGLQVWRLGGAGRGRWSETPRWWGAQSPSQFGHLILKAKPAR